jgi:DNA (cytosine-5)-methyltransferase 1
MSDTRGPRVQLVRGPFLRLEPHQLHCESAEDLGALCHDIRSADPTAVLAADLFAGAGGLSLGLEQAGLRVVIGADHDREALETHRHHFAGMALDWDLGEAAVVERIAQLIRVNKIDVLAGGPPCQPFSKAGRSRMRHLVREGVHEPHDRRRDLWRSFLEVARLARPRAVVMENVPEMALDREMFILRSMVHELEAMGYRVQVRVVDAWRYGVPQFRQRLILVATLDNAPFDWPAENARKVTVANAISDLPPVRGGWRPTGGAAGWAEYSGPRTSFQRAMRTDTSAADEGKVFDHITRPVREDDERAFELLDAESRYSDLPPHLKRYRDDIFDDKYKRLSGNDVSRTITAHIAKDGYWYIHPEQNRTLTVREAARLQTFPDTYRFAGPPSAAFKQIGNAVPPRLGLAVGLSLRSSLGQAASNQRSSEQTGQALASWFRAGTRASSPWLRSTSIWHVLLGELVLGQVSTLAAQSIWPLLERLTTPNELRSERLAELGEILSWVNREQDLEHLVRLAATLGSIGGSDEQGLESLVANGLVHRNTADLALLAAAEGEEPVVATVGALRLANRFHRSPRGHMNQKSDGRIAIARTIGFGPDSRAAHLAVLELGNDVCLPARPRCDLCPLSAWCRSQSEFT